MEPKSKDKQLNRRKENAILNYSYQNYKDVKELYGKQLKISWY